MKLTAQKKTFRMNGSRTRIGSTEHAVESLDELIGQFGRAQLQACRVIVRFGSAEKTCGDSSQNQDAEPLPPFGCPMFPLPLDSQLHRTARFNDPTADAAWFEKRILTRKS